MSQYRRLILALPLLVIAGCGGNGVNLNNPGDPPPHKGTVISFPEGNGFVEVVKGSDPEPEATFYFLKDMKTPFSPAPTSGQLKLSEKQVIELKPKDGGLATPAGANVFKGGDPSGSLYVDLDGKRQVIPVDVR
jgi:hypothetical protein